MALWDNYDDAAFDIVTNPKGQHSVWPVSHPRPHGWTAAGFTGTQQACLDELDARLKTLPHKGFQPVTYDQPAQDAPTSLLDPAAGLSFAIGADRGIPDGSVTAIIRAQTHPLDRVAATCGQQTITRAELLETSRAWASVLTDVGCGPEVPVTVLVPRGVEALIAILAVLEAGGAYVPLSCDYPAERIESILADCGSPIVITADGFDGLPASYSGTVLTLSALDTLAKDSTSVPAAAASEHLAYIFYTSGTTGEPKGVEGTHGQLVNYALWCRQKFPHRSQESILLSASLFFLGSLTTMFTPLLEGWPIIIAPEGATTDALVELASNTEAGMLKLTPTHIRMMMARGVPESGLARQLMVGSEPLTFTREIQAWMGADPVRVVVNHYGLTETHGCFCHWLTGGEEIGSRVPIGKPIENVEAYIVDKDGALVGIGEVGELLVGGPSLGRGYHGQPGLTAQRWIPHPWGTDGARLLRTGDLARLGEDGNVTVLGRADRQVKIRGHRVEPAAIEEALRTMAHVKEALVLPRVDDGKASLDLFLLADAGADVDLMSIRTQLQARFPPQWIPARMAVLPEFPVNPNGKVDTRALPEPLPVVQAAPAAAGSDRWSRMDRDVAAAFCDVLKVDDIGLFDSFYDLGGDSLTSVEVAALLAKTLHRDVPVPSADASTVRAYAVMLSSLPAAGQQQEQAETQQPAETTSVLTPPRVKSAPLAFGQLSVYRVVQTFPIDRWSETYLINAVAVPPGTATETVRSCLARLAERHESLRTHFIENSSGPAQVVVPTGNLDIQVHEVAGCTEARARELTREHAGRRFEWETEFAWRALIITDSGAPVFAGIVVDHIVADGAGLIRLSAELQAMLGDGDEGSAALLAETPCQPLDLALAQRSDQWQRRRASTEKYWNGLLRDFPATVFPWPPSAGEAGRIGVIMRSPRGRHSLGLAAHRIGTSPHSVLLTLFAIGAGHVLGLDDVVLTLQSGNRSETRWRGIVSSMNQYAPLALNTSGAGGDFVATAKSAHRASLTAYWHGSYDFDVIREQVRKARGVELDFDCFFNYLAHDVQPDNSTDESPYDSPCELEDHRPARQVGPRLDMKIQGGPGMPITVRVDPLLLSEKQLSGFMLWLDDELWRLATQEASTVEEILSRCVAACKGQQ